MSDDLKRRLDELARQIMAEDDPETLSELMVEMDLLWRKILSRSPPEYRQQKSRHVEEALRMYKPTSIDIEWAQATMRILHEGAMLVFPDAQLQYKVSHLQKVIVLMNVDQLNRFDSFVVHLQTISTFHAIGYEVLEYRVNIQ